MVDISHHALPTYLSRRGCHEAVIRACLADLQFAVTEVQLGMDDDTVDLGGVDEASAEHRTVEFDGIGGTGDGEERGQARRPMRDAIGSVVARNTSLVQVIFVHASSVCEGRPRWLEDSRRG